MPPPVTYHHMQLPKTKLHYIMCGEGPPLIMVPATISKIENWLALAQFMGQRFTVYFFELPGHGKSSPFPEAFTSELAAETVEAFMDSLGHRSASLLGFSFGGILALTTLRRLRHRIDKVILFSPVVSQQALKFSAPRRLLLKRMVKALRQPRVRSGMLKTMRSPKLSWLLAGTIGRAGKVESSISMEEVFSKISDSTADVLSYQLEEMLEFEMGAQHPFKQPCFFAMSVHDPLLSFDTTLDVIRRHFPNLHVEEFQFPFHQPPKPPTFEELNQHYRRLLDTICLD